MTPIERILAKMVGTAVEVVPVGTVRPEADPTVHLYVPLPHSGFALLTRHQPAEPHPNACSNDRSNACSNDRSNACSNDRLDTVERAVVKLRQGWLLTHTFRIDLEGRAVPVRVKVYLDSYVDQSYALFEVFNNFQWQLVHNLSGYQIDRTGFNYTAAPSEQLLDSIAAPLTRIGLAILGIRE